jgi:hypothetical protein
MRTMAWLAGMGMLLAACSADPLGGAGELEDSEGRFDSNPAVKPGGPVQIAMTAQGTGEVIGCSSPAACRWRFTGTATGTPLQTANVVVDIVTTGTWDASGCQQNASGAVSFFRRDGQKNSIGWRMVLSGTYCTGTVGASQQNVAKLTIHVVKGQNIQDGFAAAQKVWGDFPAAITVSIVESLAVPGALVEIEGIAAVAG